VAVLFDAETLRRREELKIKKSETAEGAEARRFLLGQIFESGSFSGSQRLCV
jgi:hypothetical protein